MEIIMYIMIFLIGVCFGSWFYSITIKICTSKSIFSPIKCSKCGHELGLFDRIPIVSYLINFGKCKYCNEKIDVLTIISEIVTGILFLISYISFNDVYPENINILFSIMFISSLVIIIISDIKYMIIPNEVLIIFGLILLPLKIYLYYLSNIAASALDIGYELLFTLLDGFIVFIIMYLIRKIGNKLLKVDSMGGGDVKLMFFISMIMGWKLGIVVLFLGSFIGLPIPIINMYKNKEYTLAFGPYLAVATLILFLSKINFDMIIEFLK